jgi:hypothetical protein
MSDKEQEVEIDDDALELAAGGKFTNPVNTTRT